MPATEKSSSWFIRVTASHEEILKKLGEESPLWSDVTRVLGVLHVGSKTEKQHCHFVVELASEIQKQSMVARVKKYIEVSGNKGITCKVWDKDERACQYLFAQRSKPKMFIAKAFTQEQVDSYVASASTVDAEWDASHPLGQSQRGNSHKDSQVTQYAMAKELSKWIDRYQMNAVSKDFYIALTTEAISIHNKYEKTFCDFSLRRIMDTAIGMSEINLMPKSHLVQKVANYYWQ